MSAVVQTVFYRGGPNDGARERFESLEPFVLVPCPETDQGLFLNAFTGIRYARYREAERISESLVVYEFSEVWH